MNAKIKIDADGAQGALLKDLSFVIGTKGDKESKTGAFDIGVHYKDRSLATVSAYLDEEVLIVRSDELFGDTLYIDLDDLNDLMYGASDLDLEIITSGASALDLEVYNDFAKKIENDKDFKAVKKNYQKFFEKNLNKFIKDNGKVDVSVVEGGKNKR